MSSDELFEHLRTLAAGGAALHISAALARHLGVVLPASTPASPSAEMEPIKVTLGELALVVFNDDDSDRVSLAAQDHHGEATFEERYVPGVAAPWCDPVAYHSLRSSGLNPTDAHRAVVLLSAGHQLPRSRLPDSDAT